MSQNSQIVPEPKPWEQMSDAERTAHIVANSRPRDTDWSRFRKAIREKAKRKVAA